MALSFYIPEAHIGKPVELEGVTLKPYRDLDHISGCDDANSVVAEIGNKTRTMQERVLAVSAVTPGNVADHEAEQVFPVLNAQLAPRLTPGTGCFVMGENGTDLYMCTREGLRMGALQMVGGFGKGITDGLENRRALLNGLTARHLAVDIALLDLPAGALLVETGAGADYERLTVLRDHALECGSRLIAHDTIPAAARTVGEKMEGIPYVALPHRHEFIGRTLETASCPKVITLQNVISSMAFGSIDELLTVAGLIDADKVMISQSLAITKNTNMLPNGFHPGDIDREYYIAEKLMRAGILSPRGNEQRNNFILSLVSLQARSTMEMLLMEIARMHIQTSAAKTSNMPYNRTLVTQQSTEIDASQVRSWLEKFKPGLIPDFENGAFNTFTTGPFNECCTTEPDVPPGTLRIKGMRFTLELSKKPLSAPSFPSQPGQIIRRCDPKEFITPKELRRDDPRTLYGGYLYELHAQGASISLEEARRTLDINALLKFGATLGHEMLFSICGRKAGSRYINQYQGSKENQMFREFVNQ